MWSEQGSLPHQVTSGHPGAGNNSSAAAMLAYDVPHRVPWDWRLSLYTWTKGIAAGAYLVPLILLLADVIGEASPLWRWAAPVLGGLFLGLTGVILIADLEHPERFHLIFTRPQWRSWLVRGAFVIAGYSAVLAIHFAASVVGAASLQRTVALAGLPLALLTAVYTAYLFAQAKARDLWQSALLPPHFAVQAVLAGSAALLPLAAWLEPVARAPLGWLLAGACVTHLAMVLGEVTLTHPTAHARLAVEEMTERTYRPYFQAGLALVLAGAAAPWLGVLAAPLALAGLLAHEHAYMQAGQSVPLA